MVPNLTAYNNAYENLVTYRSAENPSDMGGGFTIDADGVAPALAESWEATDQSTTLTLRQGVKSQHGNRALAQAGRGVVAYERERRLLEGHGADSSTRSCGEHHRRRGQTGSTGQRFADQGPDARSC